jgi:hypothetical protein
MAASLLLPAGYGYVILTGSPHIHYTLNFGSIYFFKRIVYIYLFKIKGSAFWAVSDPIWQFFGGGNFYKFSMMRAEAPPPPLERTATPSWAGRRACTRWASSLQPVAPTACPRLQQSAAYYDCISYKGSLLSPADYLTAPPLTLTRSGFRAHKRMIARAFRLHNRSACTATLLVEHKVKTIGYKEYILDVPKGFVDLPKMNIRSLASRLFQQFVNGHLGS